MPVDPEELKRGLNPAVGISESSKAAYERFKGMIRRAFPEKRVKEPVRGKERLVDPNDPKIRDAARRAWGR